MTSLPVLKRVSSLPTNILDRILLTHMLYEMRYSGSVCRWSVVGGFFVVL